VWLAQHGFAAVGVDVSPVAVRRAISLAEASSVGVASEGSNVPEGSVQFVAADLLLPDAHADLQRMCPALSGGVTALFDCQTYHVLRIINEPRAAALYAQLVSPGGWLILYVLVVHC
jgi:hypothetical protein